MKSYSSELQVQLRISSGPPSMPPVFRSEVDSQSILDNKDGTKKFLINKMLESSQDSDDARAQSQQATHKTEVYLTSSNKVSSPHKMANGIDYGERDLVAINGRQEQMHLVEAKLCYIDQAAVLPSFNGLKRDKSTSTIITENKIAQEIEECRLREEELKLQRFERFGQTESMLTVEEQIISEVANGSLLESVPTTVDGSVPRRSSPIPILMPLSEISGHASEPEETPRQPSVDEDFAGSRIKVRPLQDDSDDEDKPMYVVYNESAVEREIRLAKDREEELRREKLQRELAIKGPQQDNSPVILKDASILKESKEVATMHLVGAVTDSSSTDRPVRSEVFQSTLEVPALRSPLPEDPVLRVEVPVQNGHVSLIQKRSGHGLTLPTFKNKVSSRVTEQNMASARLQEEVNEVIQKELALKECGSIATTSQDRIDEKVINIRQYKVERIAPVERTAPVPQSAPPIVSMTPAFKEATITTNGSQNASMARQVSYAAQSNGTAITTNGSSFTSMARQVSHAGQPSGPQRSNLYRSPTTKGMMARFINSKGRMSGMPVFVPKVTKPAPVEVIVNPAPQNPVLEIPESLHQVQELNIKEDTVSVNGSEQEQVKPKPELQTYRRNYSMVENKILSELQDMRQREDELRKQRTALFRRNSKGSLESLLESEDSGENNGHSESPSSFDGINSFAKDYDSDNSLENQTYLQDTTRKPSYWINQWEERLRQNES